VTRIYATEQTLTPANRYEGQDIPRDTHFTAAKHAPLKHSGPRVKLSLLSRG